MMSGRSSLLACRKSRWRRRARAQSIFALPAAALLGLVGLLGHSDPAGAQNASSGSLLAMVNTLSSDGVYQFDALDRQAAIANDTAFAKLQPLCATTSPAAPVPSASCAGATVNLYDRLRELEIGRASCRERV